MADITKPNPAILRIVEAQYRDDKEVSKDQMEQIALLMTRSLADPVVRKTLQALSDLENAREKLEEKYEKDGVVVHKTFVGGDLGQLTKVTLKTKANSIELTSGQEFEAFKGLYDKRASQVKGLHLDVLKVAAKHDFSANATLRAAGMLYSMIGGELNRELLESIDRQVKESGMQTKSDADERMRHALAAFEQAKEERPAGGSPGSLGPAKPQRSPDFGGRS